MKNFMFLLLVFLAKTNAAFSQNHLLREFSAQPNFLTADPFSLGATPQFNGTLPETLDFVFDSITALTPIKGFNAALLLPDGSVWKRAKGLSKEIPAPAPLTTEHLMGMGSISKSFVATTLLLLFEDGLLDLGDSIGKFVGPYPNVPGSATIRQLLSHRTGINDYLNQNPAMGDAWVANLDSVWVADTILNNYVLVPNFSLDSTFSYSNTNFLLAGRIIESVTGQPWHQVVRQKLLDPLGLSHTFSYPWETSGNQPFSHVWADLDDNGTVDDVQGFGIPDEGLFSIANSAGCLISTPEDLVKFSEKVYGGQVLKPTTLAEMQTDYVQDGSGVLYGLGAASFPLPQNLENWGHDGDLIYKSVALYFPSEKISLAVQQNDDRSFDPTQPAPVLDASFVFLNLLDAYLNWSPPSATHEFEGNEADFSVFPNPASDKLSIETGENGPGELENVRIFNSIGQVLGNYNLTKSKAATFDISRLAPGIYFIEATGAGNVSFGLKKVVVE